MIFFFLTFPACLLPSLDIHLKTIMTKCLITRFTHIATTSTVNEVHSLWIFEPKQVFKQEFHLVSDTLKVYIQLCQNFVHTCALMATVQSGTMSVHLHFCKTCLLIPINKSIIRFPADTLKRAGDVGTFGGLNWPLYWSGLHRAEPRADDCQCSPLCIQIWIEWCSHRRKSKPALYRHQSLKNKTKQKTCFQSLFG